MEDTYGRRVDYLRLSVTERCNLRCRYCMPEDGICKKRREEMLTEEEMVMAVKAAASLGISKLRITGGEPLVKRNILSICDHVSKVEGIREVCITTNGILLPRLAKPLREAGVRRVNISLDTLNPQKYFYITRRDHFGSALAGIQSALDAGFEQVKINSVLIRGFNDDEIQKLAELTLRSPVDVRFIELMPMNRGDELEQRAMVKNEVVLDRLPQLRKINGDGGVAQLYRLPGAKGNIGLISPVSHQFCSQCSRIRLTADGKIKPCLHSNAEYNIKGLKYEEVAAQFRNAIMGKPEGHGGLGVRCPSGAGRNMNEIGG